jgi:site-specific recombinase XerC
VADRIRWYRREILPRLNAPADGDLFVTGTGTAKHQATLAAQIGSAIAEHVGVAMSPHQFRHLAAHVYLEGHPEDYQTVTDLLGHSWAKTTQIYAGLSGRRASRAYNSIVLEQRQALQLKRPPRRPEV